MNRIPVVVFVMSLVCSISTAGAQATAKAPELAPSDLLAAVLSFRYAVVESSTPVIACSVVKVMETPSDFPHAFPIVVQNIFDRRYMPCEPVEKPPLLVYDTLNPPTQTELAKLRALWAPHLACVWIDSVRRVDSRASVYVTAQQHGDAVHSEEFRAEYQASRKLWVVVDARLYNLWYPHGRGDGC